MSEGQVKMEERVLLLWVLIENRIPGNFYKKMYECQVKM